MKPSPDKIRQQVQQALEEDIGTGDVTAALIPAEQHVQATVVCREEAVLCGCDWFDEVFQQLDPSINITWQAHDADGLNARQTLCTLHGPARPILSGERTALNFLQTLSGTATTTRRYVDAIAGTGAQILDTRKTLPGLRLAQKYAVLCGGGKNHRMGSYDMVLIKENHVMAAGSIKAAIQTAQQNTALPIEVEVETLDELKQALTAGADRLLLDNMDIDTLKQAVAIAAKISADRAKLEASGNVTLDNIRQIAETGVDFISVGAISKHLRAIDLSMRFRDS